MRGNPIISFKNVEKIYGSKKVLKSLSFEIYKNDMIGISGASGIGKTTILRLIANLEKPTSGEVELQSTKISYVFQEDRLIPWKTALQNVMLPLMQLGLSKEQSSEKAKQYLDLMELNDFVEYYPSRLSGGMKQRVSLARAFAIEPDILLLDEPFSALDVKLKDKLMQDLKQRLKERAMTVIYISHSPYELVQIVDQIFTFDKDNNIQKLDKEMFLEQIDNSYS